MLKIDKTIYIDINVFEINTEFHIDWHRLSLLVVIEYMLMVCSYFDVLLKQLISGMIRSVAYDLPLQERYGEN
jgi:hypothetical protein